MKGNQQVIDGLKADLDWLGIRYDRIEQQSKRMDRYAAAAERLKAAERFYECFESPVELDLKRKKLLNMGRPPVYDRAALALTEEQKAVVIDLVSQAFVYRQAFSPKLLYRSGPTARLPDLLPLAGFVRTSPKNSFTLMLLSIRTEAPPAPERSPLSEAASGAKRRWSRIVLPSTISAGL